MIESGSVVVRYGVKKYCRVAFSDKLASSSRSLSGIKSKKCVIQCDRLDKETLQSQEHGAQQFYSNWRVRSKDTLWYSWFRFRVQHHETMSPVTEL